METHSMVAFGITKLIEKYYFTNMTAYIKLLQDQYPDIFPSKSNYLVLNDSDIIQKTLSHFSLLQLRNYLCALIPLAYNCNDTKNLDKPIIKNLKLALQTIEFDLNRK